MSIQSRLGRGEELQSNCKRIRLSTYWEINNPAGWQVNNSVLGASSAKQAVFYSGFNDQLFLMDSTDSSQYINSKPTVIYRPSYYAGLFYNGPVASTQVRYPPEWEYGKFGPFLTTNNYGDNFLGGSVENTPVPSFKLTGPAIATSDLSFSHGREYGQTYVSDGRYSCSWVLGPGPREFLEIRGNPSPEPRPREPRHDDSPDDKEDPETKTFDLVSFFFFVEEQNGSSQLIDYGDFTYFVDRETQRIFKPGDDLFLFNIRADLTARVSDVPTTLLMPHGVTFLPEKKQFATINKNDFTIYKNKTDFAIKSYYDLALSLVKETKSLVFAIPNTAKIWSYSVLPTE
jgi:hypothetical protein